MTNGLAQDYISDTGQICMFLLSYFNFDILVFQAWFIYA